jgi:hypothetical protein
MKIVLMSAKMIGQPVDALREERNLYFGRPGILRVRPELRDDRLFLLAL